MTQTEFNKQERFNNLLQESKKKGLGYRFILDEFKRNHWNLNLKQAEMISENLEQDYQRLLKYALDLNILNVDSKTKKAILKQFKKETESIN